MYLTDVVRNDTITIQFPAGLRERMVEVRAVANIRDVFGITAQHEVEFANQVVIAGDDPVAEMAAVFEQLGYERVAAGLKRMADDRMPSMPGGELAAFGSGVLYSRISTAAKDGQITPREYRLLVDQARRAEAAL